MELRSYQKEIADKACNVLHQLGIVYIAAEVRTGKSLMALETCRLFGAKKVLFLTKKKAIKSVSDDYSNFLYSKWFDIVIINDESMHTLKDNDFDIVVHDEHHRFGAFPKPGKYTKEFKSRFSKLPMIFLSGTPHPETVTQIFHQFWVSDNSPFRQYKNFYQWFTGTGLVRCQFNHGYGLVTDYSNTKEAIFKYFAAKIREISKSNPEYSRLYSGIIAERSQAIELMNVAVNRINATIKPYMITFTQSEAGFETKVEEHVLICKMKESTYKLINRLKRDKVIEGKDEVILADTAVKLMGKIHQLSSGTIKFESGKTMVIDHSKAEFIKDRFKSKKIGIFYKFVAEYQALKDVYGDGLTNDIDEFNSTDKNIALQIVSGREGISLEKADVLVFYNIDFSSTSYWQARDRMSTMHRLNNDVYWVFSDRGIEQDIYKTVLGKKSYTLSVFSKGYGRK